MPKKKPKRVGPGAPPKYDSVAIGEAKGTAQEVALKYGCSVGQVYLCRKQARIRAEGKS